jgi:ATP/maltotriose-dependent transcriptional regulator MalT
MARGVYLKENVISQINELALIGISDKKISEKLKISHHTIQMHTSRFWNDRMKNKE